MKTSTLAGALCIALAAQAQAEDVNRLVQRHFKIVEQVKEKCPLSKDAYLSKALRETCLSRLDRARRSQVKVDPLCKKSDNCGEPRAYLDELAKLLAGPFPEEPEPPAAAEATPAPEPETPPPPPVEPAAPAEPSPPVDSLGNLEVVDLNSSGPSAAPEEPPLVAPPPAASAPASAVPAPVADKAERGESFEKWLAANEAVVSALWKMREGKGQPQTSPQDLLTLIEQAEKLATSTPDCQEKFAKKGEGKAGYRNGTAACALLKSWRRILGDHASASLARRWKRSSAELSALIKALAERGQISPKENPRIANLKGQWEEQRALFDPIMKKVSDKWDDSPPSDLKSLEKWYQTALAQAKSRRNWPTIKAKFASAQVAKALTEMAGKLGVEVLGYGVATPGWNPEKNAAGEDPKRTRDGVVELRLKGEELCRVYEFTARQTYNAETHEGNPAAVSIDLASQPYRLTRCKPTETAEEEN